MLGSNETLELGEKWGTQMSLPTLESCGQEKLSQGQDILSIQMPSSYWRKQGVSPGVEHVCHRGEKDIAFKKRFPAPGHGGILKQGLST